MKNEKKGYEENCWIFALRYYQHRTVNMDLYYILPIPDHVEQGVQDTLRLLTMIIA